MLASKVKCKPVKKMLPDKSKIKYASHKRMSVDVPCVKVKEATGEIAGRENETWLFCT